jgi:hypothetical protein
VAQAYEELKQDAEVFEAYQELYQLSLIRPHRLVSFLGFRDDEVRAIDAAMITTQ